MGVALSFWPLIICSVMTLEYYEPHSVVLDSKSSEFGMLYFSPFGFQLAESPPVWLLDSKVAHFKQSQFVGPV